MVTRIRNTYPRVHCTCVICGNAWGGGTLAQEDMIERTGDRELVGTLIAALPRRSSPQLPAERLSSENKLVSNRVCCGGAGHSPYASFGNACGLCGFHITGIPVLVRHSKAMTVPQSLWCCHSWTSLFKPRVGAGGCGSNVTLPRTRSPIP